MTRKLRISDLSTKGATEFDWTPDASEVSEIAERLGLVALRKMRLIGQLLPVGTSDWKLQAKLGATVVQPCVATLTPVTSRIDEPLERTFLKHWVTPEEAEIELEPGEESDPLPDILDLGLIAQEALSLALPLHPRSPEADGIETNFAPKGVDPLTDEASKPFAGLADLKKKLENGR